MGQHIRASIRYSHSRSSSNNRQLHTVRTSMVGRVNNFHHHFPHTNRLRNHLMMSGGHLTSSRTRLASPPPHPYRPFHPALHMALPTGGMDRVSAARRTTAGAYLPPPSPPRPGPLSKEPFLILTRRSSTLSNMSPTFQSRGSPSESHHTDPSNNSQPYSSISYASASSASAAAGPPLTDLPSAHPDVLHQRRLASPISKTNSLRPH